MVQVNVTNVTTWLAVTSNLQADTAVPGLRQHDEAWRRSRTFLACVLLS